MSSNSTSPSPRGFEYSQISAILIRIDLIILLTEFLLTPEISEIFLASKSRQKNFKISQTDKLIF